MGSIPVWVMRSVHPTQLYTLSWIYEWTNGWVTVVAIVVLRQWDWLLHNMCKCVQTETKVSTTNVGCIESTKRRLMLSMVFYMAIPRVAQHSEQTHDMRMVSLVQQALDNDVRALHEWVVTNEIVSSYSSVRHTHHAQRILGSLWRALYSRKSRRRYALHLTQNTPTN